jgi:hypothetical protein
MIGQVNEVNSRYGVTVLDTRFEDGASTVGNYIIGPPGMRPDWRDHLFVHEYGHYIQSQRFGPFYFSLIAMPSLTDFWLVDDLFGQNLHDTRWYEAGASRLAADYFDRHEGSGRGDYFVGSVNHFDRNSFVTGINSIGTVGSLYVNPRTGFINRGANPTAPIFHWTDIPISNLWGSLPGMLFSIFKFH